MEISLQSVMDPELQSKTFQWSRDNICAQLPVQAGQTASITVYVHAASDFLAPIPDGKHGFIYPIIISLYFLPIILGAHVNVM